MVVAAVAKSHNIALSCLWLDPSEHQSGKGNPIDVYITKDRGNLEGLGERGLKARSTRPQLSLGGFILKNIEVPVWSQSVGERWQGTRPQITVFSLLLRSSRL